LSVNLFKKGLPWIFFIPVRRAGINQEVNLRPIGFEENNRILDISPEPEFLYFIRGYFTKKNSFNQIPGRMPGI
jgi:hypothetical protein